MDVNKEAIRDLLETYLGVRKYSEQIMGLKITTATTKNEDMLKTLMARLYLFGCIQKGGDIVLPDTYEQILCIGPTTVNGEHLSYLLFQLR